jgi:hypothetical protein
MGHVDSVQNGASAARLAMALRTMVASVSMTQPRLQFGLALYVVADVIHDFFSFKAYCYWRLWFGAVYNKNFLGGGITLLFASSCCYWHLL